MRKNAALPYATILVIDAAERESSAVALLSAAGSSMIKAKNTRAQELPALIDRLLSQSRILPANVKAVALVKRDGSVTANRIGTATANTFAWLNRLPIIEINAGSLNEAVTRLRSGEWDRVVKNSLPS